MTDRDHLDRRLAAALEQHFSEHIRPDRTGPIDRRAIGSPPRPRHTVWVTSVVAVFVVLVAVAAIRTGTADRSTPAVTAAPPTVTGSSDRADLRHRLPTVRYGRVVHTWTDTDTTSATGPWHVTGDVVYMAGVCSGDGALSIVDVDGKGHTLDCTVERAIQQPFARFNLGGDGKDTVSVTPEHNTVRVLRGRPTYLVRMWALDPRISRAGEYIAATSASVPRTLRSCAAGDIAPTGTLVRIDGSRDVAITITNRSSTDCAIRSWPALRYLDPDGAPLGAVATHAWNSSTGDPDRYHEFPPARLRAGGHAYLTADLDTTAHLSELDRQLRTRIPVPQPSPVASTPAPERCDPHPVAALALTVAGNRITVDASAYPDAAACRSQHYAVGVSPVITRRPTSAR